MRNRHLSLLITASSFVTGRLTVGRGRLLTGCRPSRHRRMGTGGQACRVSPVDIWPVYFQQPGMYSSIVFPLAVFLACGMFSFFFFMQHVFFPLTTPPPQKNLKNFKRVIKCSFIKYSLSLCSFSQASKIKTLYEALSEFDRRPLKYEVRTLAASTTSKSPV